MSKSNLFFYYIFTIPILYNNVLADGTSMDRITPLEKTSKELQENIKELNVNQQDTDKKIQEISESQEKTATEGSGYTL